MSIFIDSKFFKLVFLISSTVAIILNFSKQPKQKQEACPAAIDRIFEYDMIKVVNLRHKKQILCSNRQVFYFKREFGP